MNRPHGSVSTRPASRSVRRWCDTSVWPTPRASCRWHTHSCSAASRVRMRSRLGSATTFSTSATCSPGRTAAPTASDTCTRSYQRTRMRTVKPGGSEYQPNTAGRNRGAPPAASVALARSACAADRPWGRCAGGGGASGRGGGDGTDVGEVPSSSLPASRARCRPPSAPRPARWPHLVLQRIAAGGALLALGRQPRRGEPAGGGDDLRGGSDLHAQVVEAAAGARVLDEDQLQRRVVDGEVGVPRAALGRHGGEELGVEGAGAGAFY